jgi:MFS family permease
LKCNFVVEDLNISTRRFFSLTFLNAGTLAWFFLLGTLLGTLLSFNSDQLLANFGLIFFFIALSAIVGSVLIKKVNSKKFLWLWIASGAFATASIIVTQGSFFQILSILLVGVSWGLGLPYCLSLLATWTTPEERARVSGFIIFLTFGMVSIALLVVRFLNLNPLGIILLCISLRCTSFFALFSDSFFISRHDEHKKEKYHIPLLQHRNFLFYLFPWLMFNLAVGLVSFVWTGLKTNDFEVIGENGNLVRFISFALFGLVSGFIADRYGRKTPIILGLVMLGISFTFLGLATQSFTSLVSFAVIFYYITSGIAWGFLTPVYLAVLGDLPFIKARETVYALGIIVPLLVFVCSSVLPILLDLSAPANVLSIALSVMLFVSVIPILYASETLPETNLRARKMRNYINKVGKLVDESRKSE